MQPPVTVALATVWLVVGLVGGTVTLRLPHDQYSPASPRHPDRVQLEDQSEDWRDHDLAKDQPLDLWIGSRRSISARESPGLPRQTVERGFPLGESVKDIVSSKPLLRWQGRLPSIADTEFAADKVDYSEMPETLSRAAAVPPPDSLNDPFVADDTFQDQGPGSVEIYKLDLSKEKALLTATTPSANFLLKNKSKPPKKTGRLDLPKTKATDVKPTMTTMMATMTTTTTTMDSKIHHRQSNLFDEQRTETPVINRDAFDVGGVPELQVGCEGLEASSLSHKAKRSIGTSDKKEEDMPASVLLDVTPVSLDFDYDLSYDEADFEEMDELLKIKRLETTTRENRPNRGDMDASHLNSEHLDESRRSEKLPVRGDLGKSIAVNSSGAGQEGLRQRMDSEIKNSERIKVKRKPVSSDDDDGAKRSWGRRLLWHTMANTEGFPDSESERKLAKRSIDWGFGEDEGVVSSDELQTVNERRRQHEMRYHQNVIKRRDQHRETNPEIDNIKRQYEQLLQQKRREEEEKEEKERLRQGDDYMTRNRWEEEERRRNEMKRRQHEKYRRRMDYTSTPRTDDEGTRRRQMEERRRQEAVRNRMQEMARRNEEERRRQEEEERGRQLQEEEEQRRLLQNRWQMQNTKKPGSRTPVSDEEMQRKMEEARRQDQYKRREEEQRRRKIEERQRQENRARHFSEDDRKKLEERHREWTEKRRQEEEDERRRQQVPSNLMHAGHRVSQPNDIRQRDRDEERRMWEHEERLREQKLQEYIARNQPINVNRPEQRSEEDERQRMNASRNNEEHRRRLEEQRKIQEEERQRMNASRDNEEHRRRLEEQRKVQEGERKLQDYIRSNQPINSPKSNATSRDLFEERRRIEEARRRGKYPDPGAKRPHGPSPSTYIDPHSSLEQVRWRQQETAGRLEEERQRHEAEERRKELARRQKEREERQERWLQEERTRKEAARREEEARREQSQRYEGNRKRLEALRLQAERRRQEMLSERSRSETAGQTRQPEATRPIFYQDPYVLAEHRRRQDSRPIPSNLMLNQAEAWRAAAKRERQETQRRWEEESRMREHGWEETDQRRRQELARLNSLPVSARIILLGPDGSPSLSPLSPPLVSRTGFDNGINFTGINPSREGIPAPKFPVPPTLRPPVKSPGPCVWAVVQCCSSNNNRLVNCFESMGCPGINWDPNPCRGPIAQAARREVMKFYAEAENQ